MNGLVAFDISEPERMLAGGRRLVLVGWDIRIRRNPRIAGYAESLLIEYCGFFLINC